jgi:hypothetical protein
MKKNLIIIAIIIILAGIGIGGYFVTQQKTNLFSKNKESDIVSDFTKSSYRVVAVLQNPFAPYSLIIATERSEAQCGSKDDPSRCTDDSSCGSIYTSPNCYFFVKPHFVAHTDASTRFVEKWRGGIDGLNIDSIKFKDANNVQFDSAGGDAGVGVQAVWNLDLKTGQITQVSRQEFGPNK